MNLLLLTKEDFDGGGSNPSAPSQAQVVVRGERLVHLRKVLRAKVGDQLKAGLLDGKVGRAEVLAIDARECRLEVELDADPPSPLPASLVLALPRPKFLGRILQSATTMGVKAILLIDTTRVEKSFWSSSLLEPARLRRHLLLGLAQGRDTILPGLELERSWHSAVERLRALGQSQPGYVADGDASIALEASIPGPATIVVGPEGGLLDDEIKQLDAIGFATRSLGARPLRVETAVAVLLGRVREPDSTNEP